jgi:16S rRNA processing protein RimM
MSERAAADAPDGVIVGRVVGAHGLRGELRVRLLGEMDNNLNAGASVSLVREEGDPKAVEARVRAIGSGRRGEARLALDGVDSREAAEALRGRLVLAPAGHLEPLSEGEYYQYELVGCRVEDGEGRTLGVVSGIWETGAPDVLVVVDESAAGREHLIPAAGEFLREVDLEARRIVIDVPPGLLDADSGNPESGEKETSHED